MAQTEDRLTGTLSPGAHDSVRDALKRTLEGELITLANVPQMSGFKNHSKEGGGGEHSKCGHDHSKGGNGGEGGGGGGDEVAHARFAERLLELQRDMSAK